MLIALDLRGLILQKVRLIALIIVLLIGMLVLGISNALAYSDVSSRDWFYSPVSELSEKKFILGYPDGTFKPNNPVTRAEFATIIARALDLGTDSASFKDTGTHWAKGYIGAVLSAGIMKGYPDGTFKPNNNITRAEIATAIVRAFEFDETSAAYVPFKDTASHWAIDEIKIANQNGIINGYPGNVFKPNTQATRAESAAMISRALYAFEPVIADGEVKTSGSIRLSATNWRYQDTISGDTTETTGTIVPPTGYHFLSLDITIKNVGEDTVTASPEGFMALYLTGESIGVSDASPASKFFKLTLAPSAVETGTVSFEVPKAAEVIAVSYDYKGVKFPIIIIP